MMYAKLRVYVSGQDVTHEMDMSYGMLGSLFRSGLWLIYFLACLFGFHVYVAVYFLLVLSTYS